MCVALCQANVLSNPNHFTLLVLIIRASMSIGRKQQRSVPSSSNLWTAVLARSLGDPWWRATGGSMYVTLILVSMAEILCELPISDQVPKHATVAVHTIY